MLDVVTSALNEVLWYPSFLFNRLFDGSTALGRFFIIGIAISVIFVAIKIIKSTIWGR